jgi:Mce-associated membrane protein
MDTATEEDTNMPDTDRKDDEHGKDTAVAKSITTKAEAADKPDDPEPAKDSGKGPAKDSGKGDAQQKSPAKGRRVSISVRTLAAGAVVIGLVLALGVLGWLYFGAKTRLADQDRQATDSSHAEQIALDYAVNAAIMDYKDLGPWKQNLVKGTTPELTDKLTKAATAMDQILLPLQWSSTAHPLAAKVRSDDNGVYVVDAFVGVMTKNVQAADSLQSTATYSITVDSNNAWRITDVGGIDAVVGHK